MKIRLTRKLAEFIDGVDLRSFQVGDVVDLAPTDAYLLLAEGWASDSKPARSTVLDRVSSASDRGVQSRSPQSTQPPSTPPNPDNRPERGRSDDVRTPPSESSPSPTVYPVDSD